MTEKKLAAVLIVFLSLVFFVFETRAENIERDRRGYLGVGPGISRLKPDDGGTSRADDSYELGAKLFGGFHFTKRFALEGYYSYLGDAEIDVPRGEVKYRTFGASGVYYFYQQDHFPKRWSLFGRLGVGRMKNSADVNFERDHDYHLMFGGGFEYGFGEGYALRRDLDFYDRDANLIGIYFLKRFGSTTGRKPNQIKSGMRDSDGDSVVDSKDVCPNTPPGITVNGKGCERDSDDDKVVDSKDACPNTPPGTAVNGNGCERDSDGDRVVDSKDACPDTPRGVSVDRRGCERDSDSDGIVDSVDVCPDTPRGVSVDRRGCERDGDSDGIVDSIDACPGTPKGISVDRRGCERDSDDDGVLNSVDACPDTPINVRVDRRGCERDDDGDGIVNSEDSCPDTPRGMGVDTSGCVRDSDGDGIKNSRDKCLDTAPGTAVDARGCPLQDVMILKDVRFATNSSELIRHSEQALDEIFDLLIRHPKLKVEIAGHTDSRGPRAHNLALSQQRAESVRNYLVRRGISPRRLIAKGYGPDQPIANNVTAEGQAANRRVELHVIER